MLALAVVLLAFFGTTTLTIKRGTRGAVEGLWISIALCVLAALVQPQTRVHGMSVESLAFNAFVYAAGAIPTAIIAIPIGLSILWIRRRLSRRELS